MKILVIPDVHETTHYKKHIAEHFDKVDKVVFLGDYFDYHGDEPEGNKFENFENICQLKRNNPEKVFILFGNHDNYIADDKTNAYQYRYCMDIARAILKNKDILQIAVELGGYVFSHAGISIPFLDRFGWTENDKPLPNAIVLMNEKFQKDGSQFLSYYSLDYSGYGEHVKNSSIWIRPNSLMRSAAYPKQVVGHTALDDKPCFYKHNDNCVIFLDSEEKDQYLIIDTEKEFDYKEYENNLY